MQIGLDSTTCHHRRVLGGKKRERVEVMDLDRWVHTMQRQAHLCMQLLQLTTALILRREEPVVLE